MKSKVFSKASLFLCILIMISIYTSIFANASYINPHGYIGGWVDGDGIGVSGGYFETPGDIWLRRPEGCWHLPSRSPPRFTHEATKFLT